MLIEIIQNFGWLMWALTSVAWGLLTIVTVPDVLDEVFVEGKWGLGVVAVVSGLLSIFNIVAFLTVIGVTG